MSQSDLHEIARSGIILVLSIFEGVLIVITGIEITESGCAVMEAPGGAVAKDS